MTLGGPPITRPSGRTGLEHFRRDRAESFLDIGEAGRVEDTTTGAALRRAPLGNCAVLQPTVAGITPAGYGAAGAHDTGKRHT
jgi:hypothetical protein